MITKQKNQMLRKTKILLAWIVLSLGLINPVFNDSFVQNSFVYAEDPPAWTQAEPEKTDEKKAADQATKANAKFKQFQEEFGFYGLILIKVVVYINWVAIWFMSMLMDNTTVYSPNIVTFLHEVWILSRDICNYIFILILAYVAIKSIVDSMGWKWLATLKGFITKFIIWVVMVNFSWQFVEILVDVGQVLTTIVYKLPEQLNNINGKPSLVMTNWMDSTIMINFIPDFGSESIPDKAQKLAEKAPEYKIPFCVITEKGMTREKADSIKKEFNKCRSEMKKSGIKNCWNEISQKYKCDTTWKDTFYPHEAYVIALKYKFEWNKYTDVNSISRAIASNFIPYEQFHVLSSGNEDWVTYFLEWVISFVIWVMSFLVFICLAIIMAQRLFLLWIFIMLSPFGALIYVLEAAWVKEFKLSKFISDLLTQAVIIPVRMALLFIVVFLFMGELYYTDVAKFIDWNEYNIWDAWKLIMSALICWVLWTWAFDTMKKAKYFGASVVGSIKKGTEKFIWWHVKNLQYVPLVPKTTSGGADDKQSVYDITSKAWDRLDPEKIANRLSHKDDAAGEFSRTMDGASLDDETNKVVVDLNLKETEIGKHITGTSMNRVASNPEEIKNNFKLLDDWGEKAISAFGQEVVNKWKEISDSDDSPNNILKKKALFYKELVTKKLTEIDGASLNKYDVDAVIWNAIINAMQIKKDSYFSEDTHTKAINAIVDWITSSIDKAKVRELLAEDKYKGILESKKQNIIDATNASSATIDTLKTALNALITPPSN